VRSAAIAAAVTSLLLASSACAETTVDPSATAGSVAAATTTTIFAPTGTTAELLDQLLDESGGLSDLIVENEAQQEALARIETLWAAVADDIAADRPDLQQGFESAIGLARTGVERRRPADADKAHNNLRTLVAAYTSN
jgi:hypothetical protein